MKIPTKFRQRRIVQWSLAYLAGAWLILQLVNTLAAPWNIPGYVERWLAALLAAGFFFALVIAWYHGEKGQQKLSGPELLLLAALFLLSGGALSLMRDKINLQAVEDSTQTPAETLAVLPFSDFSFEHEYQYFADGVATEIISALVRHGEIKVIGRASSFALRDRSIREVGAILNVATVLAGTVRTDGEKLRVDVELVNVADNITIWAQQFDRKVENVLQIQAEISAAVVRHITGSPSAIATEELIDPAAYDRYARARFLWNRRTEHDLIESVADFKRAIELAPNYALAYSGLADAYAVLGFYQYLPPGEAFPEATRHARAALQLDPGLAESLATIAYVKLYYDWDWVGAEALFKEAIELNERYPVAHQWYANLLVVLDRPAEALREIRTAIQLDPLSLIARAVEPWAFYYSRDYASAEKLLDQVIELNPDYMLAHYWKGWTLQQTGDFERATAELQMAASLSGRSPITLAALARAFAVQGKRDATEGLLQELVDPLRVSNPPSYEIAKVYLALGNTNVAIEWLEKAYKTRANQLVFAGVDPELDELREHPAFIDLLARLGFPR